MKSEPQTRRAFLGTGAAYALGLALPGGAPGPVDPGALLLRAGNSEDEQIRYRLLKLVSADAGLAAGLRGQLEPLLELVNEWANGREQALEGFDPLTEHRYLNDFFGRIRPEVPDPAEPPVDSPLHPLWALYRGRMLIWYAIQMGWIRADDELRNAYHGEGRRLLEVAGRAYPENRLIGMYFGRPIPWPAEMEYPADPAAPAWANLQREGLEKLADIIHWWIDERQLPNGEYGGGWGDDVEMWRWWTPVLIGFRDPIVERAQELLSSAIFRQPHMLRGFTSKMDDVEHIAEDSADTITPMMHVAPENPEWEGRARRLVELMRDVWTGRNQRGQLQFRSVYFNVDEVQTGNPNREVDVIYNARTLQPAFLLWQRSADAEIGGILTDWLDTWVDAAARAERGKPAGVLPSVIRWPTGEVGGVGENWWDAEVYPDRAVVYYNWPSQMAPMLNLLLLAYQQTGREAYLGPIRSMAAIWSRYPNASVERATPGTEEWTAAHMPGFMPAILAKYGLLTGDRRFHHLLEGESDPYVRFRASGARAAVLVGPLEETARALRSNWPAYTSEVRWTDRVIAFVGNYLGDHHPEARAIDSKLLYATATGDLDWAGYFPVNAVRWRTLPREIAALVTDSGPESFGAELYHFGVTRREMEADLYLLKPGRYVLSVSEKAGTQLERREVEVSGETTRIGFALPPRREVVLRLAPSGAS